MRVRKQRAVAAVVAFAAECGVVLTPDAVDIIEDGADGWSAAFDMEHGDCDRCEHGHVVYVHADGGVEGPY